MSDYGVTLDGFVTPSLAEVLVEVEGDETSTIDTDLDTDSDAFIGQINAILADKTASAWELAQTVADAFNDENAEGILLDWLCALTGTKRVPLQAGSVYITCTLTSGTPLTTSSQVSDPADSSNAWKLRTAFTPTADGTFVLIFDAIKPGPIPALAGSLTHIDTPVSGWTAATNATDATEGTIYEQDPDLRIRRRAELRGAGRSNNPALESALIAVTGIVSAFVVENTTDSTDSEGRPPHSFEVLIFDGATPLASDDAIRAAIFANQVPGIQSFGTTTGIVVDRYGKPHVVNFTRLAQVNVTLTYTIVHDSTYPGDGDAQVMTAILALQKNQSRGSPVVFVRTESAPLSVQGVTDITACTQAAPGHAADQTNITIPDRSIAIYDSSRVTIVKVGP